MKCLTLLFSLVCFASFINTMGQCSDSTADSNEIIHPVETHPKFAVEGSDLLSYIRSKIKEWKLERADSIPGKLFIQFVVTAEGEIRDVVIVREVGTIPEVIKQNAIRLVRSLKVSQPAQFRNKTVSMRMIVPFFFSQ